MTSKELTKLAVAALEDRKAEDVTVIDISEISPTAPASAAPRSPYGHAELCGIAQSLSAHWRAAPPQYPVFPASISAYR